MLAMSVPLNPPISFNSLIYRGIAPEFLVISGLLYVSAQVQPSTALRAHAALRLHVPDAISLACSRAAPCDGCAVGSASSTRLGSRGVSLPQLERGAAV